MHRGKPTVAELNLYLTCRLCKGFFIDATTIVECLHSFCRSCIVKYLASNKYCPVCDVQVHKTKPLLSIRPDKTLQDIVYKLVPRLLQNEAQRRREFYQMHPECRGNLEQLIDNYQHIITTDEPISLTLSYFGCKESLRYLRCPAAVTIGHLQKLIRAKYDLKDNHRVDILYNQECLNTTLTLMDLAYIYSWKRKGPMELYYKIYVYKTRKLEIIKKDDLQNNNWKEVQLRISENGEMSIIQDEQQQQQQVNNNNCPVEKKELPPKVGKDIPSEKKLDEIKGKGTKRKSTTLPETKQAKQTILNHSLALHNLSNNHPLKKHSKNDDSFTKPQSVTKNSRPGTPKPCYMPKAVINIPKPSTSVIKNDKVPTSPSKAIKTKPSTPIGYKTLRDPPKSWNSQIAKANLNKPIEPKYNDLKNVRPAKFFKIRNNLPRYLGNPASGVKPMYPVQASPEKDKASSEIKKHSIVKIDPKTLKPISEKAPETSSLSNSDVLKINTSSVPIFNPLKLQNSTAKANERKSPKSPQSPKATSGKQLALPSPKRDKLNLNFTPSNPFVPNLTTPTVSPNQFLYSPGFPPYDPRVMAAYHSLLYGQRSLPFTTTAPSTLSVELSPKRNFELVTSPKQSILKLPPPPSSPTTTTTTVSVTTTSQSKTTAPSTTNRKLKESKGEKSLQITLEKLTQNRVKEINNKTTEKKKEEEKQPDVKVDGEEKKGKEEEKKEKEEEKKKKEETTITTKEKEKTNGEVTEVKKEETLKKDEEKKESA